MAKIDHAQLLEELTHLSAYAEGADSDPDRFAHGFHVVPEHLKAFDPSVLLVLGSRGSGKSYLFQAVTSHQLAPDLRRIAPSAKIPEKALWIEGFTNAGKERPAVKDLIRHFLKDPESAQDFWLAALVRSLRKELPETDDAVRSLVGLSGAQIDPWLHVVSKHRQKLIDQLDKLDERFLLEGTTAFIGYDELDTLVDDDPDRSGHALTGLIAFWAGLHRRWKALRPKLFLRTDLYRKYSTKGGADLAKLSANRVEIRWNDVSLNGVLFKQILNLGSDDWLGFLKLKASGTDSGRLGKLLVSKTAKEFVPAYLNLVGKYMGEGPRKGLASRWPIEHVRDGMGSAHPRALIALIRRAAELQGGKLPPRLKVGEASYQTLLQPTHIRRALSDVSLTHVNDVTDAWPWIPGLKAVTHGQSTPLDRKLWLELIERHWSSWTPRPNKDAESFLEELLEVGVLRTRPKDKLDASELYSDGLGLRRKGGVQRKEKKRLKPKVP
ncbi:MAG: hypothetical protein IPO40_08150 [Fibrobacteres bacterium]|nr:hypothetical protein [Fibrobacterota bacterium]